MGKPRVIRVVVVVDRRAEREDLVALIGRLDGVEVAGSAAGGAEALELLSRLDPVDAVLVDLTAPVPGGAEATGRITRDHPGVAVLALTKDAGHAEIKAALRVVASGKVRLPDGLTAREAEVLGLITTGLSNGEIAAELVIAEATVKTHINNAFAKIGVRNRIEALRYAVHHGLGRRFTT